MLGRSDSHNFRIGLSFLQGPDSQLFAVQRQNRKVRAADLRRVRRELPSDRQLPGMFDLFPANSSLSGVSDPSLAKISSSVRRVHGGVRVGQGPPVRGEGVEREHDNNSDSDCGRTGADWGGYVCVDVGFAIFKCMRKKKGVSRLLEEDYQE